MEKRSLGNTGLEPSVLGFGGFHLIEITAEEASRLLNSYLDKGGNYIETAAGYGDGLSEEKIGRAVAGRRGDYFLATKTIKRDRAGCASELDRSLRNLRTDHVDVLFMHCVATVNEADLILAEDGALQAALEAQKAGKVRFIGITGHGRPDGLLSAVSRFPFAVLMTQFNYFDRFSFPTVEGELLPLCRSKGIGVLAMKAVADGYLYRSLRPAIRYALSLPITTVVMGINSREMLESDLAECESFTPLGAAEAEKLYAAAPELGNYVCRLCGKCADASFDPQSVFLLEGLYDRQMDDMHVSDSGRYALRERLKFWYAQKEIAAKEYERLALKVDPKRDYRSLNPRCPYFIDIDRKLKIAHAKLSRERYIA